MKKVTFNQEGVDQKRNELESLPQEEFREQLELIQYKTKEWVLDNFILNNEQVDYLNSMPKKILDEIGLSSAIAFDNKLKLTLETPQDSSDSSARFKICKNTDVGGSTRGHWTPGSSPKIDSWQVNVRFTIPLS